ncbi:MAG: hypothetical protein ACE5ER_01750 [Nitrospinaceae bacterium]
MYTLMRDYTAQTKSPPAEEFPHPELGLSLCLLHACLLEAGLESDQSPRQSILTAAPEALTPNHLSRFVVGFLPFHSITSQEETNTVLFEVYSFLRWLEQQGIPHGWSGLDFSAAVRRLLGAQERCLKLTQVLDDASDKILEEPPHIHQTVSDLFRVIQLDPDYVHLRGIREADALRLRLPKNILGLMRSNDHLDLVLGDTSDRWVLLEAGQVFPEFSAEA